MYEKSQPKLVPFNKQFTFEKTNLDQEWKYPIQYNKLILNISFKYLQKGKKLTQNCNHSTNDPNNKW
jgi:hypothetical protein